MPSKKSGKTKKARKAKQPLQFETVRTIDSRDKEMLEATGMVNKKFYPAPSLYDEPGEMSEGYDPDFFKASHIPMTAFDAERAWRWFNRATTSGSPRQTTDHPN